MQDLSMTPSTLILLGVIVLLAVLAVRRLLRRGMCDCGDHCSGCEKKHAHQSRFANANAGVGDAASLATKAVPVAAGFGSTEGSCCCSNTGARGCPHCSACQVSCECRDKEA